MEDFILAPFTLAMKKGGLILIAALPIIFLLACTGVTDVLDGSWSPATIDGLLSDEMEFSATNISVYDSFSTNIQLPLIRLGGIAGKTDIRAIYNPDFGDRTDFLVIFATLIIAFLSYSMIARSIARKYRKAKGSLIRGINPATIILSIIGAFLMLFIASFTFAGFSLMIVIIFGVYFTFAIPYAATGRALGESLFLGWRFFSTHLGRTVGCYVASMGVAIMAPIALLIFINPLLANISSPTVAILLSAFVALVSIVFALFYQMALCATALFADDDEVAV